MGTQTCKYGAKCDAIAWRKWPTLYGAHVWACGDCIVKAVRRARYILAYAERYGTQPRRLHDAAGLDR